MMGQDFTRENRNARLARVGDADLPEIPENCTDLDTLTRLLAEFCAATELPEESADELLASDEISNHECAWLSAFLECWEDAEAESTAPIRRRAMLGQAYAALIGYDPFEDDPDATADGVAQTLSEFLAEPGATEGADPRAVDLARRAVTDHREAGES